MIFPSLIIMPYLSQTLPSDQSSKHAILICNPVWQTVNNRNHKEDPATQLLIFWLTRFTIGASPAFINISRFGNNAHHPYFSGNITSLFLLSLLQNKNLLKTRQQSKAGRERGQGGRFSQICKEAEFKKLLYITDRSSGQIYITKNFSRQQLQIFLSSL